MTSLLVSTNFHLLLGLHLFSLIFCPLNRGFDFWRFRRIPTSALALRLYLSLAINTKELTLHQNRSAPENHAQSRQTTRLASSIDCQVNVLLITCQMLIVPLRVIKLSRRAHRPPLPVRCLFLSFFCAICVQVWFCPAHTFCNSRGLRTVIDINTRLRRLTGSLTPAQGLGYCPNYTCVH